MDATRKLSVYLCHGLQDKDVVHRLYERLLKEGWVEPWLDEKNLLPGQDREEKHKDALRSTDVALVCLSKQSLGQKGEFHREIRLVVDLAKEKLEGSIFIIPIRLDDCTIPHHLHQSQYVDFFTSDEERENAYLRIRSSLKLALEFDTGETPDDRSAHVINSTQPKVVENLADLTFGGFTFVKIPNGKFIMGSRASNNLAGDDEHPQRRYEIPYNYWITQFPVSNEQYSEYAVSTRHIEYLPKDWKLKLDQPVVNVSWHDVMEYTKWLNRIFKKEIPNELVFRLPTEAEWERASRGNSGWEWPWGKDNLDDFLDSDSPELLERMNKLKLKKHMDGNKYSDNFAEYFANFSRANSSKSGNAPEISPLDLIKMKIAELRQSMELTDVGAFSPITDSPYEIADMVGSVREWTQSLYKQYPYDVDDGREDLKDSGDRVVRGYFEFSSERFSVRCARRKHESPITKGNYLGFRIVVAPPTP